MKKLFLGLAVVTISITSVTAQKASLSNPTTFSLGIEGSVPTGNFNAAGYNFGIGGSAQVDHKISTDAALSFYVGYLNYSNKNTTPYKYHLSVIPVLGGVKYWFSPKVYGSAQVGAAFNSTKQSNGAKLYSSTGFAYSPGIGFNITNGLDLLIKYLGNSANGGSLNSVGARLAYTFGN